jgi:uncharacterized protein YdaU (DUF1376 family)
MSTTKKSPAFQFYPSDFLVDENVVMMGMAERGIYITLMCYCWREGSIPADVERLGRMCNLSLEVMAPMWRVVEGCFEQSATDASRLVHPRLEGEREKQAAWREKSAIGGRHSRQNARKSSGIHDKRTARVVQPPLKEFPEGCFNQGPTLLSSSSSSSLKKEEGAAIAALSSIKVSKDALIELPAKLRTPTFEAAWDEWKEHRREIKKPLKPTMIRKQLASLEAMGPHRATRMIEHTIAQGWTGLREPENRQFSPRLSPDRQDEQQRREKNAQAAKVVERQKVEADQTRRREAIVGLTPEVREGLRQECIASADGFVRTKLETDDPIDGKLMPALIYARIKVAELSEVA